MYALRNNNIGKSNLPLIIAYLLWVSCMAKEPNLVYLQVVPLKIQEANQFASKVLQQKPFSNHFLPL